MFTRRVKSLAIDTITDISLTERNDGSGVITFGPTPPFHGRFGGSSLPWFTRFSAQFVPNFELVGDARHLYEIIRAAPRAAKGR